jgi:cystathionine beta-lyase/cystathionine gamma-synthase
VEPTLPPARGGFATRAVRAAATTPQVAQQPLSPAIWPAVTWGAQRSHELGDLLTDAQEGYVYGRYDNPTATTLHALTASLHGTEAAWSLASGTAAIHAVLEALRGTGRVLATSQVYGGTYALLRRLVDTAGWRVDQAELLTVADLDAALTEEHTVVHVETIANPSTAVADIAGLAARCRERGVALVVDNTFASPYLCRPVELGATAVVESATKYLAGHGDVVAGVVAADEDLVARVRHLTYELGASLGAFEAWLVVRGAQTLALRMAQASRSARDVAEVLAGQERIEVVRYPGLEGHPQRDLAHRQFGGRGAGGMLSFDLASRGAAEAFADACEVLVRAVSLGGTHSLVLHPASTSHRQLDGPALARAGLGEGTVRLSLGIEETDDLVADVRQALDVAMARSPA